MHGSSLVFFSLFCAKQYLHCYIEVQSILNGLKYSIPLAGTSFLTGCSPLLERSIISLKFGVADLGNYSFASKITLLVTIFISGIQLAVYPFIMRNLGRANFSRLINNVASASIIVIGCVTVSVALAREFLMEMLVGQAAIEAAKKIAVL